MNSNNASSNHSHRTVSSNMELVHGTCKASRVAAEDFLSNMPENVITHILECLPIQDAVRTGILSRNWRFKWNMLSKLVFDGKQFVPRLQDKHNFNGRTISRLLPHLKGVITKFYLCIPMELDVEDVSLWVMLLSRKGIKEFTLLNMHTTPLKLPTYLFSCLELKLLKLSNCCFHVGPTFCGFLNLMNLGLYGVRFESGNIGKFITRCPLLEILRFSYNNSVGKVKLAEIAKLENLKTLYLPLCKLESVPINSSNIFELVKSLPKLQDLNLEFINCTLVVEGGGSNQFPTTSPCLKTLTLQPINFSSREMLSFTLDMIWGCPNLQILNIVATYDDAVPPPLPAHSEADYSRVKMLQLESVVFTYLRGSEAEVYLIKSILACSPLLKTIAIYPKSSLVFGGDNGKLMFATKLLNFHRASTIAEVNIYWS